MTISKTGDIEYCFCLLQMITKIKKEISCLFVSAIFVLCFHLEVVHIKVNNIFFFWNFLANTRVMYAYVSTILF